MQPTGKHTALLISPFREDYEFLRVLFAEVGCTLNSAMSVEGASRLLREPPAVVVTEADLPVGTWKDVLDIMAFLPNPPLVIVASLLADEYLWAEALNLGAHDVLAKPFNRAEVIRVLTTACSDRKGLRKRASSA